MFFFGHLGIGNTLAAPFKRGLSKRWILLGTILPDLIDKPLYYSLVLMTGKRGAQLGLISGSRTIGHTALFLLCLTLLAYIRRSKIHAALALGIATHFLLDGLSDLYLGGYPPGQAPALLWPFTGPNFPVMPFATLHDHLQTWRRPFDLGGEIAGLLLLSWDAWKKKHRREIREFVRERRQALRKHRLGRRPSP